LIWAGNSTVIGVKQGKRRNADVVSNMERMLNELKQEILKKIDSSMCFNRIVAVIEKEFDKVIKE